MYFLHLVNFGIPEMMSRMSKRYVELRKEAQKTVGVDQSKYLNEKQIRHVLVQRRWKEDQRKSRDRKWINFLFLYFCLHQNIVSEFDFENKTDEKVPCKDKELYNIYIINVLACTYRRGLIKKGHSRLKKVVEEVTESAPMAAFSSFKKKQEDIYINTVSCKNKTHSQKVQIYRKRCLAVARKIRMLRQKNLHIRNPMGLELKLRRVYMENMNELIASENEILNEELKAEKEKAYREQLKRVQDYTSRIFEQERKIEDIADKDPYLAKKLKKELLNGVTLEDKLDKEYGWRDWNASVFFEELPEDVKWEYWPKVKELFLSRNRYDFIRNKINAGTYPIRLMRAEIFEVIEHSGLIEAYREGIKMKAPVKGLDAPFVPEKSLMRKSLELVSEKAEEKKADAMNEHIGLKEMEKELCSPLWVEY